MRRLAYCWLLLLLLPGCGTPEQAAATQTRTVEFATPAQTAIAAASLRTTTPAMATPSPLPRVPPMATPSPQSPVPSPATPSPRPIVPSSATPAPQTTGITEAAIARSVKDNKQPETFATEFTTGETVYITYTASNVKAKQFIDMRVYRNGRQIQLFDTQITFERDDTYYGYYSYAPTIAASYKVELYFDRETTPSQSLTFVVK